MSMSPSDTPRPSVLYVCIHNAGRSQMAAAYTHHLSGGAVEVRSAGSAPADSINPAVRDAMLEEGIDISAETPKILTTEAVQASATRMEYCSISSGCVVGTISTAIWLPLRASKSLILFASESISSLESVPV